ncbi:MAG: Dam family site-specific DNA-(adenine-N6)-methyltransferase [Candidatus Bathyarchaeota archaeon]|nr:Dam family site-specific DNA-(adenine-N6)-methyltransferase [Candidatus Termiticorpusculum sp.]
MSGKTPHVVQYQGSKRILAPQILQYMPHKFKRLLEPFSGMAAVSIAVAVECRTERYIINDLNEPIVKLLKSAIETPSTLVKKYEITWSEQFKYKDGHVEHFNHIRDRFNSGEQSPENMLYLLARCVKGSVRYGKNGKFNQSPDKRRHGTNPKNVAKNVHAISALMKGKVSFSALDYHKIFELAQPGDLVYMDPPYQGVTNNRDNRYFSGVSFDEFVEALETLNNKGINYLISYDGKCGGREYGKELPQKLECTKILLNAGLSTQATLLGKHNTTYEALYLSKNLSFNSKMRNIIDESPKQMTLLEVSL